ARRRLAAHARRTGNAEEALASAPASRISRGRRRRSLWFCLSGQSERDVDSAARMLWIFPAAGRDYNILLPIDHVRRRRGIPGKRQFRLPQQFSGRFIERVEFLIEVRRADKNNSARGDNRPAVIFAAGVRYALRDQRRILAEIDFPRILAGVEID